MERADGMEEQVHEPAWPHALGPLELFGFSRVAQVWLDKACDLALVDALSFTAAQGINQSDIDANLRSLPVFLRLEGVSFSMLYYGLR